MKQCVFCHLLNDISTNRDVYFVKKMWSGSVFLEKHQYFYGYVIFALNDHKTDLLQLSSLKKKKFLEELTIVARAVDRTFHPMRLNYALLGNSVPHLHWHIIPRYQNDPYQKMPVWSIPDEIRKKSTPSIQKLTQIKTRLLQQF